MTDMPEAPPAAELEMAYACLGVVVNYAAGIDNRAIDVTELPAKIEQGIDKVRAVLSAILSSFS